jgi:hypothetical protein
VIRKSANAVTFIFPLQGRDYKAVSVAGDFNKWNPGAHPMKRQGDAFQLTVELEPGEHQFRYCADGQWLNDPEADGEIPNAFGSRNCVLKVTKPADGGPAVAVAAAPAPAPMPAGAVAAAAPMGKAGEPEAPITGAKGRHAENSRRAPSAAENLPNPRR